MMTTDTPTSPVDELQRLEILRAYKRVFAGTGNVNDSPFSEDRVVRIDADVEARDIPEIHDEVRKAMLDNLAELHQGRSSRVVILAGQPGMGKSHLLNYFRSPALQREHGYVLVGDNNFWKVEEFEQFLLTWLVTALVRPTEEPAVPATGPFAPSLLLDKISALSFQVLEQILDQPGHVQTIVARSSRVSKWWPWKRSALHADLHKACQERDMDVFRKLDFHRFADYACERFLHNKSNPFHRFVLHVLLRFLFPEDRNKVCAWLIGQKVHEEFFRTLGGSYRSNPQEPVDPDWQKEIGISDRLDLNYKLIDTLKILISLFSPEVSRNMGATGKHPGQVFFFAFDQAEGRNELFEKDADWQDFFGKLSELYNTLPNVFIVFTMTLGLREKLYPQMEGQFQQRISKDKKFVLHGVEDREIVALYRRRLELWRAGRIPEETEDLLVDPGLELLPFTQEQVLELARKSSQSVRGMLDHFDADFRDFMNRLVVEAEMDYHVAVNELLQLKRHDTLFDVAADHLDHVRHLFDRVRDLITKPFGLTLVEDVEFCETTDKLTALKFRVSTATAPGKWVRVFIVLLPYQYRPKIPGCLQLLTSLEASRNFLWLVRAGEIKPNDLGKRQDQVFMNQLDLKSEVHLQALIHLLDKQQEMIDDPQRDSVEKEKYRQKVAAIMAGEIKLMYLGEMLQHAAEVLEKLAEGGDHDAE